MNIHPTTGHRAWFALNCLPRRPGGMLPSVRSVEVAHGLSNGSLGRLIWDVSKRPSLEQAEKLASALHVTVEWLFYEEGPGPVTSRLIDPRPPPPPGMAKRARKKRSERAPARSRTAHPKG